MEQHGYRILDLETYYRKDIYRRFTQVARSSVSITHRIDVTDLVEHSHRSGTKFYINFLYLLCGLSDVLDGAIARLTGTTSRLGESLDAIADTVFIAAWIILFLPTIIVGKWIWICVGLIALVKVVNIVSGFIMHNTFVSKHTYANKATGLLLFLLPVVIKVDFLTIPYLLLTCLTAAFAAIQEGHLIRSER